MGLSCFSFWRVYGVNGEGGEGLRAIEAVYRAYFQDVRRYALSLCKEQALAEDLAQETFLKAMDNIHTFRGECELRFWLLRITRNLFLSHLRKQGRLIPMAEVPEETAWQDPGDSLAREEEGKNALRAVLALPEPARAIVLLRAREGLAFKDIAALYRKSENWACVTYHRARNQLLKALEEHHDR